MLQKRIEPEEARPIFANEPGVKVDEDESKEGDDDPSPKKVASDDEEETSEEIGDLEDEQKEDEDDPQKDFLVEGEASW